MQAKTRGIVLGYIKYNDNSIIASIYTEEFGRQSFLISGIKSKKARIRLNLFQPLYLLNLDVDIKPGRTLQRIREMKVEVPFHSIPYDIVKSTQALFLAEMLGKALKEEEKNEPLFDFIFHAIAFFDTLQEGKVNYHILFLLKLSRLLGFFPNNNYQKGYSFDLQNGCFTPDSLTYPNILTDELNEIMSDLIRCPLHELNKLNINATHREYFLNKTILYYSLHLDGITNIKSLQILHDIFK